MAKTEVALAKSAPGELAPMSPVPVASMYDSVGIGDIVLPRVYTAQPLSQAVQNGAAEPGDLYLGSGADDPAPAILVGDGQDHVIMYVIGREKFAATTAGGGIEFHQDKRRDPNDPDSWEGWFFDVAIPSADAAVPARWMLWKTAGSPAARAINTLIERNALSGNYDPLPIKVTVREKTNKRGQKYHAPAVAPAEADDTDLAIARKLQALAIELRANRTTENDRPELSAAAQPSSN